jgi:uncharacterized protein (TIGR03083 family)
MDARALAAQERADLATFLSGLSPGEWDADTLCAGWRVRDVVAHLISYDELSVAGLAARMVRAGLRPDRANAIGLAEYRRHSPAELVALLRAHLRPSGLPAAFGGMIALTDGLIHHQDIRRPLGMPRRIPADRLRPALRFALTAPVLHGFWLTRGLRLVATDLDWTAGHGPEVRGPGEALLLVIAGRRGVVGELSGPGRDRLAGRLGD